jgi:hypothetical protein
MKRRMAAINASIERYLTSMDTADRAEPEVAALKKGRLQDKINALKQGYGSGGVVQRAAVMPVHGPTLFITLLPAWAFNGVQDRPRPRASRARRRA